MLCIKTQIYELHEEWIMTVTTINQKTMWAAEDSSVFWIVVHTTVIHLIQLLLDKRQSCSYLQKNWYNTADQMLGNVHWIIKPESIVDFLAQFSLVTAEVSVTMLPVTNTVHNHCVLLYIHHVILSLHHFEPANFNCLSFWRAPYTNHFVRIPQWHLTWTATWCLLREWSKNSETHLRQRAHWTISLYAAAR
jgi:hypothetical protein